MGIPHLTHTNRRPLNRTTMSRSTILLLVLAVLLLGCSATIWYKFKARRVGGGVTLPSLSGTTPTEDRSSQPKAPRHNRKDSSWSRATHRVSNAFTSVSADTQVSDLREYLGEVRQYKEKVLEAAMSPFSLTVDSSRFARLSEGELAKVAAYRRVVEEQIPVEPTAVAASGSPLCTVKTVRVAQQHPHTTTSARGELHLGPVEASGSIPGGGSAGNSSSSPSSLLEYSAHPYCRSHRVIRCSESRLPPTSSSSKKKMRQHHVDGRNTQKQEEPSSTEKKGRALVLYMIHNSSAESTSLRPNEWDNFKFFLQFGLMDATTSTVLFDRVDYVFTRISENVKEATEVGSIQDFIAPPSPTTSAAQSAGTKGTNINGSNINGSPTSFELELREKVLGNVRFFWVPPVSCDLCAHWHVMKLMGVGGAPPPPPPSTTEVERSDNKSTASRAASSSSGSHPSSPSSLPRFPPPPNYRSIVFMNSGVRGPFASGLRPPRDSGATGHNGVGGEEEASWSPSWIDQVSMGEDASSGSIEEAALFTMKAGKYQGKYADIQRGNESSDDDDAAATTSSTKPPYSESSPRFGHGRPLYVAAEDEENERSGGEGFQTVTSTLFSLSKNLHMQSYFLVFPKKAFSLIYRLQTKGCSSIGGRRRGTKKMCINMVETQSISGFHLNGLGPLKYGPGIPDWKFYSLSLNATYTFPTSSVAENATTMWLEDHLMPVKQRPLIKPGPRGVYNPTLYHVDPCQAIFLKFGGDVFSRIPDTTMDAVYHLTTQMQQSDDVSKGRRRNRSVMRTNHLGGRGRSSASASHLHREAVERRVAGYKKALLRRLVAHWLLGEGSI